MQAKNILAHDYTPRDAVFAARDRCDETVDHMRSVRTKQHKYIRNFLPNRPYLQPNAYKDAKAILIALREWHRDGRLNEVQALLFSDACPPEELYDLQADPYEINNLAGNPAYADALAELRRRLDQWMAETGDQGRESNEMFESDMAVYTGRFKKHQSKAAHLQVLESNIALMQQWAAEGK